MSFTLFSVILLAVVGAVMFIEIVRGLKRGFVRTAMGTVAVVLSALGAAALAIGLSDIPIAYLMKGFRNITLIETYIGILPHLEDVLSAVVDALLTPLLFLPLFLLLRLPIQALLSLPVRAHRHGKADALGHTHKRAIRDTVFSPSYAGQTAPWHRRHDRLLGGVTGGLCGFLVALLLLSPLTGTLAVAGTLYSGVQDMGLNLRRLGLDNAEVALYEDYLTDGTVAVLNVAGGALAYDAVAVSEADGDTIRLRHEVEVCMGVVLDFYSILKVIGHMEKATPEQRATLEQLGARIDTSVTARLLAADFINGAADNWLEGKRFLSVSRPSCGELIDPVMDKVLLVCRESDADCVGRDITTILNIYLIVVDSGLLNSPDKEDMMAALEEGGVLDSIYRELKRNPCMAHLADELTGTALRIMASAIDWQNFSSSVYENLMGDLTEVVNEVLDMSEATFEEQVSALTEHTIRCAEQYGVSLPVSMAEMAATAMVQQLGDVGELTPEKLEAFLAHYRGN